MKLLSLLLLQAICLFCTVTISYGWVSWTPPLLQQQPLPLHRSHARFVSFTTATTKELLPSDSSSIPNFSQIQLPSMSQCHQRYKRHQHNNRQSVLFSSTLSNDGSSSDNSSNINDATNDDTPKTGIDLAFDPRLYEVRLSRATGIE